MMLLLLFGLTFSFACTPDGSDPYVTGTFVECCASLKKCLKQSAGWAYRCQPCSQSCPDDKDYPSRPCVGPSPAPGPTPPPGKKSFKRGFAKSSPSYNDLQALSGAISWTYDWAQSPKSKFPGISFIPMIWGRDNVNSVGAVPAGSSALLGFNEPNHTDQSHMTPQEAAKLWPKVMQTAKSKNIPLLVGPAMAFSNWMNPITWLDQFFAACHGCRVDAIAMHSYTCEWKYLKSHIDLYRKYAKPIWLTEFACQDDTNRRSVQGQMAYMKEAIPELEKDADIYRYAWFSYNFAGCDAELIHDGQLTALGKVYASL